MAAAYVPRSGGLTTFEKDNSFEVPPGLFYGSEFIRGKNVSCKMTADLSHAGDKLLRSKEGLRVSKNWLKYLSPKLIDGLCHMYYETRCMTDVRLVCPVYVSDSTHEASDVDMIVSGSPWVMEDGWCETYGTTLAREIFEETGMIPYSSMGAYIPTTLETLSTFRSSYADTPSCIPVSYSFADDVTMDAVEAYCIYSGGKVCDSKDEDRLQKPSKIPGCKTAQHAHAFVYTHLHPYDCDPERKFLPIFEKDICGVLLITKKGMYSLLRVVSNKIMTEPHSLKLGPKASEIRWKSVLDFLAENGGV